MKITWMTVRQATKHRSPKWLRTAAVTDDDQVFLPADIAGDARMVMLAAAWDGNVSMLIHLQHVYLPATWLAKEYPSISENILFVANKILSEAKC